MDHYHTLQVTRDADPAVIDRAYKALSLRHHPDRVAPRERAAATKRMQRINEAYSVLSDPRGARATTSRCRRKEGRHGTGSGRSDSWASSSTATGQALVTQARLGGGVSG